MRYLSPYPMADHGIDTHRDRLDAADALDHLSEEEIMRPDWWDAEADERAYRDQPPDPWARR